MLSNTFIASRARYNTDVATIATTNSTSETANENFMTDHGSMRLRCSRARRGPRVAAPATVARAERSVSETRAAPTTAAPEVRPGAPTTEVAPLVCRTPVPVTEVVFTDDEATTEARAMTGPGVGGGVAVGPVVPVRPAELVDGLGAVPAGTPTTGTVARTVGSLSATRPVDGPDGVGPDPAGATGATAGGGVD